MMASSHPSKGASRLRLTTLVLGCLFASANPSLHAQGPAAAAPPTPPSPASGPPVAGAATQGAQPFGANLFRGHFAGQREDGINPDYRILPGDRVNVNAWGALNVNDVFTVDGQGNIFLPEIGPIGLGGVRNADLTATVRHAISRVYRRNYEVYTNLLTASPVAVFVTGGVSRPGRYAGIPSDSILFYLDQAGGIEALTGSYRHIFIIRRGEQIAELDLYDFLLRGNLPTPQFEDGDTILVGQRGSVVELRGGSSTPMVVELVDDEDSGAEISAIIARDARTNQVTLEGLRNGRPIVRTMSLDEFLLTSIRSGDSVTFRADGRAEHIVVHLEGEFLGSSTLTVRRGARLIDVLNYVPVDPELANTGASFIRRERVAEQQAQSLQASLDRLERSTLLALSDSQGEAAIRTQEAQLLAQFIERARRVRPLGRVVTTSRGRQMNVLLVDQDVVVIPGRTNVVRVSGEVQMAQAIMYEPTLTVRDYVSMSGGYTNRAETGAVIVMRQNAGVSIGQNDIPIYPGDEILIPPRIDNKVFQNAIDISSVIYQIAVAASVVLRF